MKRFRVLVAAGLIVFGQFAFARHFNGGGSNPNQPPAPNQPSNPSAGSAVCMDNGQTLSIDNEKATQLRDHQQSGFKTRLLISGTVDQVFPDHSGHRHFSVKIGPNADDHIEVIFNLSFGALPVPTVGQTVEACGDYIVSTSQNGGFPPSPDGMIIHWVHRSTSGHEPGFTILNGQLYN